MLLLLAGAAIAFVVVFVILFSNASFTEQSQSKGNALSAGSTSLRLSTLGRIVDADGMRPGDARVGDIEVTNTGARARLSVGATGVGSEPKLAGALNLKISERGTPTNVRYNGPLAQAARVELGVQQTDQTSAWRFELSLPDPIDPAIAGARLDAGFRWEARSP